MTANEQVLCVKREEIFPDGAWHGFVSKDLERHQAVIREHHLFMARAAVEKDPTYQQIIPYVVFRHGERYFLTHRLRASSERRLRKQYSLGIGGHINPGDLDAGDPILDGLRREWSEEVVYDGRFEAQLIGLLNDDSSPVSKVHLGVVFLVDGDSPNIAIRETEKLAGELLTLEEMRIYYLGMESWSQMVYDRLTGRRVLKYVEAGGVRVSEIGLGTWQFGSREWGYGAEYDRNEATTIVRRALELGVNLIDTAEVYGLGRSERIVGEAIRGRRESVFLATKIWPIGLPFMVGWRARASARRLEVDRIDLYQQHWPSPLFPPGATMPRMRRLVEGGLVGHVGVSNHTLRAWQACEDALGLPVLSNQVLFSLAHRDPERELVPWAQEMGRIVIAYSPLGQGVLSGKYQGSAPKNFRRVRRNFTAEGRARLAPLIAALREIGGRHDATAAQVALAWLIRKPNVVAIPGASSVHQLEENVAAADIELSDEDASRLDSLSA